MLQGKLEKVNELMPQTIKDMFDLMDTFYENVSYDKFEEDLLEKDEAVILRTPEQILCGFSTLKFLELQVEDKKVHGVFSGDTIIHKDYWGSMELFRTFSKEVIPRAQEYEYFYWFLISKGYKTYQMLPLFFKRFYPSFKNETTGFEQKIMDAYAQMLYGSQYNFKTGLLDYTEQKDYLKAGVADAEEIRSNNRHAKFFLEKNPSYILGTDLVCLASFKAENMRPSALRMITL